MYIGLFFGSFNPVHVGHLIIAQHLINETLLDQIWMIVSPHNPLKEKASLARDYDRLHLVQVATEDNPKVRASNIEFSLPKPSYTIETLTHLREKYPEHEFALIMGADNLVSLSKWKNYELILRDYSIFIYKRVGSVIEEQLFPDAKINILDAPLLDISSTQIRELIKKGKSVQYMVPEKILEETIIIYSRKNQA
ncbi:MAG: nicotinate-nucleotide adenylyltransferase [Saprospiraceae bacterium]|nr:nicotinate-nucleotide adenylyltransferase [Saprospiraceae bacterium]